MVDIETLKWDIFHLRASLKTLVDAAEVYASSDPDMPTHRESEAYFEDSLSQAKVVLDATNHDERPPKE